MENVGEYISPMDPSWVVVSGTHTSGTRIPMGPFIFRDSRFEHGVGLENSMGPKGSNVVGDFEKPAGGKSSNNKNSPK